MVLGTSITPFKGQKYETLKKSALKTGVPFSDPEFPASDKSVYYSGSGNLGQIEWKRPKEICESPKLFVDGVSSNDIVQGELGNCWFVAACSCLTQNKESWKKIIPDYKEQDWDESKREKNAGIFHFHFWQYGKWVDVVIDDLLPTRSGRLIFVRSKTENEFWSALLEKAYAKLFGCYEALDGGELSEALEDFTGGVSETLEMARFCTDEDSREQLFKIIKEAFEHKALMAAAIPAKSKDEMEKATDIGLVIGHAYGITSFKRVSLQGTGVFGLFLKDKLSLVRLRNPWGGCEWKGPFSDGSSEWTKISQKDKDKLGLTFEDDGEFWMTFEDFCKYFVQMSICRVVNTKLFTTSKTWSEAVLSGAWTAPDRNGGCSNNKETFHKNPQILFDVSKEDEMLFELTQQTVRGAKDAKKLTIGFTLIKVEENRSYRLHRLTDKAASSDFSNSRSVFLRRTLHGGRYVLLACTFDPGQVGTFLLRMYSSSNCSARELTLDKPTKRITAYICPCVPFLSYPNILTQIKIVKAVGLSRKADAYCVVICEGEKVKGPVIKNTSDPEWNFSAIFYRKKPRKDVKFEVWQSKTLRDDRIAEREIALQSEADDEGMEIDLSDRKFRDRKAGKLIIRVTISKSMTFL